MIETLAALAGKWNGANTLQDPHTGKPEESPSALTVTPVLQGRFVRFDYTWSYQGKPQEGSLLVGFDPKANEFSGHWIDSWHMGHKGLACVGGMPADERISIKGTWAVPPGPDWGWRIEITPENQGLRIKHFVIDPEGTEDIAVEGVYTRS